MHLPQGIQGWAVFLTGLLIIAYRIHGIDAPRTWVEWLERQFAYTINLRFIGGITLAIALVLAYFGGTGQTMVGLLFLASVAMLALVGLGLLVFQNHVRLFIVASAEGSDMTLRVTSVLIVLAALVWALVPFFF